MKMIKIFCLIFLPLLATISTTPIDAMQEQTSAPKDTVGIFPGIPWGTPPEGIKAAMAKIKGASFKSDSAGGLWFQGGTFYGHAVDTWSFDFWQKKSFWFARIQFKEDTTAEPPLEEDLQAKLSQNYGAPPETDNWRFAVAGQPTTNVISIYTNMGKGLQLWYSGGGYVDSLDRHSK